MADKSTTPVATGTPSSPGAPAPGDAGASATNGPELGSLDEVLMAELGGDDEGDAGGDEQAATTPEGGESTDDTDAEGEDDSAGDDGSEPEAESGEEADAEDDEETDGEEETEEAGERDGAKGKVKGAMPGVIAKALADAKVPDGLQKRISKAFEHSRERAAEVVRLTGELAARGDTVTLQATADHPLQDVRTGEELTKRVTAAKQWLGWCRLHPNGGTVQGKEFSAEEVAAQQDWASAVLAEAPERGTWLQGHQAAMAETRQTCPALFIKDSPESKMAAAVLKQCPELLRVPDYPRFLSWAVQGARLEAERKRGISHVKVDPKKVAAAKKGAGKPAEGKAGGEKRRPVSATPGAKPAATPANKRVSVEEAEKSGDIDQVLAAELA